MHSAALILLGILEFSEFCSELAQNVSLFYCLGNSSCGVVLFYSILYYSKRQKESRNQLTLDSLCRPMNYAHKDRLPFPIL